MKFNRTEDSAGLRCLKDCPHDLMQSLNGSIGEQVKKACTSYVSRRYGLRTGEAVLYNRAEPGCLIEGEICMSQEWKWWCFNGHCPIVQAYRYTSHGRVTSTHWGRDGSHLNLQGVGAHARHVRDPQAVVDGRGQLPKFWTEMRQAVRQLSARFSFVRVDFASDHAAKRPTEWWFTELTFTPVGCPQPNFKPGCSDLMLWQLDPLLAEVLAGKANASDDHRCAAHIAKPLMEAKSHLVNSIFIRPNLRLS